jgi:DNA-binding transcriptional MerR regulator
MSDCPWTLEELVAEVANALTGLGLTHDNGQVAEQPGGRVVRYYQSLGLLRRPQQRGRIAYYGPAHLVDVVAIKRLQASGLSLQQIHAALLGRSDAEVAKVAQLPTPAPAQATSPSERPFWAQAVAPAIPTVTVTPPRPGALPQVRTGTTLHHPSGVVVLLPPGFAPPSADDGAAVLQAVVDVLRARGWALSAD